MPYSPSEVPFVEPLLYRTLQNVDHNMIDAHEEMRGHWPGNPQKYKKRELYVEETYQIILPAPFGQVKLIRDDNNRATLAAEIMQVTSWKSSPDNPVFFETLELDGNRLRLSRDKKKYDYTKEIPELVAIEGDFDTMDADQLVKSLFVTNWFDVYKHRDKKVYPETAFGTVEHCHARLDMLTKAADPMLNHRWGRTGHMPRSLLYDAVASEIGALLLT